MKIVEASLDNLDEEERQPCHVSEAEKIRRDADSQTFVQEIRLQNVSRMFILLGSPWPSHNSVQYKNKTASRHPR